MKKKEREHLKEDPFAVFIEKVINKFSDLKKEILTILGIIIVVGIVIIAILFIRSSSVGKENDIFSKAIEIKESKDLSVDQKLAQLKSLKTGKGLSSTTNFFIASIYFEKGEYDQALKIINSSSKSKHDYINDEKKILKADILASLGKKEEGINLLNELLFKAGSKIPKDYILLKLAKNQISSAKKDAAKENLKRLRDEYPDSIYMREASRLLTQLK